MWGRISNQMDESPVIMWSQTSTKPQHSFNSSSVILDDQSMGMNRRSDRKVKDRIAMKSVKSTGSTRSNQRTHRPTSQNSDSQFESQHENMLSRQQFRTNTSRSSSNNSAKRISVSVSGGNLRSVHSVNSASDSYESGYSHISRRSEQVVPRTIQSKSEIDKNQTIYRVKVIISGKFCIEHVICDPPFYFMITDSDWLLYPPQLITNRS